MACERGLIRVSRRNPRNSTPPWGTLDKQAHSARMRPPSRGEKVHMQSSTTRALWLNVAFTGLLVACGGSGSTNNGFTNSTGGSLHDATAGNSSGTGNSSGSGNSSGNTDNNTGGGDDSSFPPPSGDDSSFPSSGDGSGADTCSQDSDCAGFCDGATCCCDVGGSNLCYSPPSGSCPSGGGGDDSGPPSSSGMGGI